MFQRITFAIRCYIISYHNLLNSNKLRNVKTKTCFVNVLFHSKYVDLQTLPKTLSSAIVKKWEARRLKIKKIAFLLKYFEKCIT